MNDQPHDRIGFAYALLIVLALAGLLGGCATAPTFQKCRELSVEMIGKEAKISGICTIPTDEGGDIATTLGAALAGFVAAMMGM